MMEEKKEGADEEKSGTYFMFNITDIWSSAGASEITLNSKYNPT